MEPFDKMKGKLREESSLPEGFGWEDMQEGIFEKMNEIATTDKEKERFNYWKLTFFLLGMVVMILLGALYDLASSEQPMLDHKHQANTTVAPTNQRLKPIEDGKFVPKEEALISKKIGIQNLRITENHSTEQINAKEELLLTERQLKSTTNSIIEVKDNAIVNQRGVKTEIDIDIEHNSLRGAKNSKIVILKTNAIISKHNNTSSNIKEAEKSTETTLPTAFNNKLSPVKTASTHIITKNDKPMWILNDLKKKHFEVIYDSGLSSIHLLSLSNPLVVEKRANSSRFSMAIGVGLNYWTPNWGNTSISQERAQYEKALIGNTYSLQFDYRLTPKWSIGTGVMNSKYYSKFNYKETDSYQKVKNDILVEIQVNTVTGDSTLIYGDRMVNVNRERTVVHYNTFQKWSVPLMVKYSLKRRKMEYAFGVGTMLTLSTKTEGKTINSTIQDYNTTSPIYQSGVEIGALGSFDLNYHLSEKYYIGAQLSGIGSLKNWSIEEEVVLKPIIFNSQLTIGIKL